MEIKNVENFLYDTTTQNVQFEVKDLVVRMVKVPVMPGLVSVFYMETFKGFGNRVDVEPEMKFFGHVAHDKYPLLLQSPQWVYRMTGSLNIEASLTGIKPSDIIAAIEAEIGKIVNAPEYDPEKREQCLRLFAGNIGQTAMGIFFGEGKTSPLGLQCAYQTPEVFTNMALELPDYHKAAEAWLKDESNRLKAISYFVVKDKSETLAAEWETDKDAFRALHNMRSIKSVLCGKKNVNVTFVGDITAPIPTTAFKTAVSVSGDQCVKCVPYIDSWAIDNDNVRKTVRNLGRAVGGEIGIAGVKTIEYRKKIIWEAK